jgi:hypothetical protein
MTNLPSQHPRHSKLRPALALALITLLASRPALAAVNDEPAARTPATALPEAPQPALKLPHFTLPPSPADEGLVGPLIITILDGEGALNNIRQRTAREPIVQVEDKNHKRVTNGYVTFSVQPSALGAGATFAGGLTTITVATDALGQAKATGLVPNGISGTFTISISVTAGTLVATTVIVQTNLLGAAAGGAAAGGLSSFIATHTFLFWTIVGVVVTGTVTGVVVATRNNGTNISAGAGTVSTP